MLGQKQNRAVAKVLDGMNVLLLLNGRRTSQMVKRSVVRS